MYKIDRVEIEKEQLAVGVFISGSETDGNVLYTVEDLLKQPKTEKALFSVYDNHENNESRDIEEGTGFPLSLYLEAAGVHEVDEVKTRSVDGFESVVSEMRSKRYYFPGLKEADGEGKEPREAFVSFYKNGKEVKFFPHPTVMFGQQGLDDKNKDFFAKGLRHFIVGNRDRVFWVKGDGIRCSRYISADQVFAMNEEGEDAICQATVYYEKPVALHTTAVKLGAHFWKEELEMKSETEQVFLVDDEDQEHVVDIHGDNWLVFSDEGMKHVCFYDGKKAVELKGIRIGEIIQNQQEKVVRIPVAKTEGDFYIKVVKDHQELAAYHYTLAELKESFADLCQKDQYLYYNHNMKGGQGGMRLVTGHGWKIAELLELLPEVPDQEFIESGALLFQVFTRDNYKEKLAAEGNELTAYRFMLAYEQDQRTETGMEKGDTSAWDDEEMVFEAIKGNTPFRIYCGKSSANPAVYKNVEGMVIELI